MDQSSWNLFIGDPSLFPTPFPDCQYKFLDGDAGPQSCHWVAKSSKIGPQYLGPKFLRGKRPKKFLRQAGCCRGLSLTLPCGKVWLSSVDWIACAKPGNEEKHKIFEGWVKRRSNFKQFVGQSSCSLLLRASVSAQYVPSASCSLVSQRACLKVFYEQMNERTNERMLFWND